MDVSVSCLYVDRSCGDLSQSRYPDCGNGFREHGTANTKGTESTGFSEGLDACQTL